MGCVSDNFRWLCDRIRDPRTRNAARVRATLAAACELCGPEIVAPVLGWIIDPEGPFTGLLETSSRQSALMCVARNLPSLRGDSYNLTLRHERYLLRYACRIARKKDIEEWEWQFLQGVRGLTDRFRNQSAISKLAGVEAAGPNASQSEGGVRTGVGSHDSGRRRQ